MEIKKRHKGNDKRRESERGEKKQREERAWKGESGRREKTKREQGGRDKKWAMERNIIRETESDVSKRRKERKGTK